jgi:hypothetical protein
MMTSDINLKTGISMTKKHNILCTGLCAATLFLTATGAMAGKKTQDPSTGGQLNQCWGQIASQVAKLDTSGVDANGGGMGVHTRAANGQGTTFGDAFGFNTRNEDGNKGRTGVGNVSAGQPHNTAPGDGGNGQHAINNGTDTENGLGFSNIIDPLTGQRGGITGGQTLECDLP